MSRRDKLDPGIRPSDGFVSRWSRRKRAAANPPQSIQTPPLEASDAEISEPLTDADMPPLASLDETSDYSGFLSEKVSETLRRQALRKLFHSEMFNVCDGLDDYAGDFTSFAKLGDIITADMRHQLAMAEEKLKAKLAEERSDDPPVAQTDDPVSVESRESPADTRAAVTGEAMAQVNDDSAGTVERQHE